MPTDYYPDADAKGDEMPMDKGGMDESEDGGQTALLPKSVLGGKKFDVGDEVVLKVTHVYEDEVAVEYATEKPEEKGTELPGDEEFDMAEKGGMNG